MYTPQVYPPYNHLFCHPPLAQEMTRFGQAATFQTEANATPSSPRLTTYSKMTMEALCHTYSPKQKWRSVLVCQSTGCAANAGAGAVSPSVSWVSAEPSVTDPRTLRHSSPTRFANRQAIKGNRWLHGLDQARVQHPRQPKNQNDPERP